MGKLGASLRDSCSEEVLLERERELGRLDELMDNAQHGSGRLQVIQGPPGIGKTSLLRETRRRAAERGLNVLHARCSELEQSFAFGAVHQLLEDELASGPEGGELMSGAAHLAAPVFAHHLGSDPLDDPSYPVLHGLYWLTANLARRRPLLIAIDDIQWGDSPSIRFVQFLGQRLEGLPISVAIAARARAGTDSRDSPVPTFAGMADAIEPAALGVDAVAKVVQARLGAVSPELIEACAKATGGNPFLLDELFHGLVGKSGGSAPITAAQIEGLGPESVSRAVLERVSKVPGATELARSVAILGDGISLTDSAKLAGTDLREAGRIVDKLVDASILDRGPTLGFSHPVVRRAIYEAISPAQRGEMHHQAATLAATQGKSSNAVAAHLLLAAPRGDPGGRADAPRASGRRRRQRCPGVGG